MTDPGVITYAQAPPSTDGVPDMPVVDGRITFTPEVQDIQELEDSDTDGCADIPTNSC